MKSKKIKKILSSVVALAIMASVTIPASLTASAANGDAGLLATFYSLGVEGTRLGDAGIDMPPLDSNNIFEGKSEVALTDLSKIVDGTKDSATSSMKSLISTHTGRTNDVQNVGIRFSGQINFPTAGDYTFKISADDGIRLYIDGKKVIDKWQAVWEYNEEGTVAIAAAGKHDVVLDYSQGWGGAYLNIQWKTGANDFALVPATAYSQKSGVTLNIPVTGITLDQSAANIEVGQELALVASVLPGDASNKAVTWTTSNPAVATVDGGVVKGVAGGTATITAKTTEGNFTATCAVTVASTGQSAEAELKTFTLAGKAGTITGTNVAVTVPYATNLTNLTPDVTVSEKATYVVSGKDFTKPVTVIVTAEDGTTKNTYNIKVTKEAPKPPTDIKLNKENLILDVKKSETLKATVTGEDQTVTWTSTDTKVATVDKNGKVTAKGPGFAAIVAQTSNEEVFEMCLVSVKGWFKLEGKWYYNLGDDAATGWFQVGKTWYYGDKTEANYGAIYTNKWIKDKGKYYYVDGSGAMLTNKWIKSGSKYYYVDKNGVMLTNKWIKSGSKWYYVDKSGVMY
ncbi:MAG: bacterial group 2 Ig-like protein, partial [Oscillospiraceae bacterium]|nr:bacterial group 2 Ig-like protein [Oscillospiraceae bacterium]